MLLFRLESTASVLLIVGVVQNSSKLKNVRLQQPYLSTLQLLFSFQKKFLAKKAQKFIFPRTIVSALRISAKKIWGPCRKYLIAMQILRVTKMT